MSRLCVLLFGHASLSGNRWSTAATPTNYWRTLHVLPCDNNLRPQPRQQASVSLSSLHLVLRKGKHAFFISTEIIPWVYVLLIVPNAREVLQNVFRTTLDAKAWHQRMATVTHGH